MERLAEHDEIGLLGGRERRWTQNTEVRGLFHRLCLGGAGSPEATQSKDEEEHTALSVILSAAWKRTDEGTGTPRSGAAAWHVRPRRHGSVSNATPSPTRMVPHHRTRLICSCNSHFAPSVAKTKWRAVAGTRKLTSAQELSLIHI